MAMNEETRVSGYIRAFEDELIGVPAAEWACRSVNRFRDWLCRVFLFPHRVSPVSSVSLLCCAENGVRIRRGGVSRKYRGGTRT